MPHQKRYPPKVHAKGDTLYYVHKNKWTRLCKIAEGTRELHRQLAILDEDTPNTMSAIFSKFADSDTFAELRPMTRDRYAYWMFGILTHRFGHLTPNEITVSNIAMYLEDRKKKGAAVGGNRERAALSSTFEYAMRQGWAKFNPCRGVRRNREKPSVAFIESNELTGAIERSPRHFALVVRFAYLTGMRICDLVLLKVADVTPEGIMYTESKTSKRVAMEWSDELRAVVREILEFRIEAMQRPFANIYKQRATPKPHEVHDSLLVNRRGKPITQSYITGNIKRLDVEWCFRQIRPTAQTDAGDDRNVLGHSGRMREVYTRRRKLVPVR